MKTIRVVIVWLFCLSLFPSSSYGQQPPEFTIDSYRSPFATDHTITRTTAEGHRPRYAIDIRSNPRGVWNDAVYAMAAGTVTNANWYELSDEDNQGGYGNYVKINHGNGWYSLYGHLSAFSTQNVVWEGGVAHVRTEQTDATFVVSVGDTVEAGQLIGFMGSTGFSTNVHLHLELNDADESEARRIQMTTEPDWIVGGTIQGQPVSDPACNDRTYNGIDFLRAKYCQDGSLWYVNTVGDYSLTPLQVKSIFVGSGWSVLVRPTDGSAGVCFNRSAWDLERDYYPNGSRVVNNIGYANVYQNSTCGGTTASYIYEDLSSNPQPGTGGLANPYPTSCSNIGNFATSNAYFFNAQNCLGEISWFSGHDANGPSAGGQASLYVPSNSVVNVSSADGGQGDRGCFAASVANLSTVGWSNRVQWAQLVPGGSCQTPTSAGGYIVHTNQGDFTVNAGQTWDNQQHNRQILGFDEIGTANLVINHHGGASRCWNETKSASSLGSDGDWWLQTKSIVVSAGNCPGNDGELIVFVGNNFQSGEHSRVQAGTTHTYEENNRKGSFKFTKPGMSAIFKVTGGRTRCWNTDVTALGDHEDYGTRTIEIRAYGTNVCPPPAPTPTPIPPAPPTNLTASVNGSDEVTLNWTNDVGYNGGTVIWEKHPGQSAFVGSLSVGEGGTSFKYFVASCGQPVEYYVEAVDSDGRKAQSNHVFASTNSCSNMVAPTGFRATPIDYDSVRLDWNNNQSGVWEGYLVSYQKEDGSWVEIWPAGRYQNYFDINGLTPCSKPWTMAVTAYQNSTRSPKSLPVTFSLPGCPTTAPQNFVVTSQPNGTANLSWTAHPYAQSYNIDYSYNGAAFQPFQIGVTSSYNGWGGYSCGSIVRLRLAANTPFGRTDYSEQSFTAPVCPSSAQYFADAFNEMRMQIYLPLVSR